MDSRPQDNSDRNWSAYEWDSHIGNTAPMRPVPPPNGQQHHTYPINQVRYGDPSQPQRAAQAQQGQPYGQYAYPPQGVPVQAAPNPYDDYDEFFYGRDTYTPEREKHHGCGCGCTTFIALLLAVVLVFTMWPTLLPSNDIIRGTQIDQLRNWLSDTFGVEWPLPSQEEIEAIYNQETRADAGYLADEPPTELLSVADALHFYRNTLDSHAQSVYDALEAGILAQDERISLPMGTTEGELQTCWQFVLYDHPGVFNLPDDAHVSYWSWANSISYLEPDYKYDAGTTEQLAAEYEQLALDLPLLADSQSQTMENICSYVADNTDYVNTDNDQYIDSVFSYNESVCAGYAKAVQYLALRHGIPCVYIAGTAEDFLGTGGNHAWLAAYVDGEVRYYDPTWYDQRGFHATQFLGMNLVEISADHQADYPQLLPR